MTVVDGEILGSAASGNAEAFATMVKSHGQWLRMVIAAHVPPGWPLQQAEQAAWLAIHQQLPHRNPQIHLQLWLVQQARGPVTSVVRELDRLAIEKRDSLTHLICESSLSAIEDGSYLPAGLLSLTVAKLPQAQQDLIQARYFTLAVQSGDQRQNATDLCNARIACDWINASATPFTEQSVLPRLIEDWLTQSIDADSRGLLSAQVAHDISRGALIVQQQRVHGALYGWFNPLKDDEIRKLTDVLVGGQKKSGKSSIRTAAQPRPTSDATRRHQRKKSSQRLPAANYQTSHNSAPLLYLISGIAVVIGLSALLYITSGSRAAVGSQASGELIASTSTPSTPPAPVSPSPSITTAPPAISPAPASPPATTAPKPIAPTLSSLVRSSESPSTPGPSASQASESTSPATPIPEPSASTPTEPTVASTPTPTPEPETVLPKPSPESPVTSPAGAVTVVAAINCGGGAFTAADGTKYQADAFYSQGKTFKIKGSISGTEDDDLYKTERCESKFQYSFPVPNGTYTVTLKFAEIYHRLRGKRVFSVLAEDKEVISSLDINEKVGKSVAFDETFTVTVSDGTLNLNFVASSQFAKCGAILITKLAAPSDK